MKKREIVPAVIIIACLAVLAVFLSGCSCTAEKLAASNVDATQERISTQYLKYVDADATLTAADKDDKHKLVDTLRALTKKLRESLGQ